MRTTIGPLVLALLLIRNKVQGLKRYAPAAGTFICEQAYSICCSQCPDCHADFDPTSWKQGVSMMSNFETDMQCIPHKSMKENAIISFEESGGDNEETPTTWVECDDDCVPCQVNEEDGSCQSDDPELFRTTVSFDDTPALLPLPGGGVRLFSPAIGRFTCQRSGLVCCARCHGEDCLVDEDNNFSTEQTVSKSSQEAGLSEVNTEGCTAYTALVEGGTITFRDQNVSTWVECDRGCTPCIKVDGSGCIEAIERPDPIEEPEATIERPATSDNTIVTTSAGREHGGIVGWVLLCISLIF